MDVSRETPDASTKPKCYNLTNIHTCTQILAAHDTIPVWAGAPRRRPRSNTSITTTTTTTTTTTITNNHTTTTTNNDNDFNDNSGAGAPRRRPRSVEDPQDALGPAP